jgi:dimethylamine/trimethylamine dehydrogenase
MGEEWRRGWHPERIAPRASSKQVMVVGAGPAGLECARALGQRGYEVILLEKRREPGGRVILEAALPGLSEWRRVVDWRLTQIEKLAQVRLYPGSAMTAADILETGTRDVIVATGARWRGDGMGRSVTQPVPGHAWEAVYTPDDLMAGRIPGGRVLVYDDDHYYMGSVLAELLVGGGCQVSLATPAPLVSYWAEYTLEQEKIQGRLMRLGVALLTQQQLEGIQPGGATLAHAVSGERTQVECDALVLVTDRLPQDELYLALRPALSQGRLDSLQVIGDALAPGLIAAAVFCGHRAAREFGEPRREGTPFEVERVEVG